MEPNQNFDLQEFVELETDTEQQKRKQRYTPYPDATDYNDGIMVSMPEAQSTAQTGFLTEEYGSYDLNFDQGNELHHPGEVNVSIPSITVQAEEEQRGHEIYSPMYHNPDSPYDPTPHSPYDHASPLGVPFPSVPSSVGSPSFAGSDWGDDQQLSPAPAPNPLTWRTRGETFGEFQTNSQGWNEDGPSIDQLIEDILIPQTGAPADSSQQLSEPIRPVPQHLHSSEHTHNLQVPGSQSYYYGGSSGSEYYLSAPNSPAASPKLSPSSPQSPRSGRCSPLPRRPRAYSSPYEFPTDNDASSPGDTGYVTGTRRKVKKNPSLYPCNQCDKKFTRAYNLRSHMRTHTHERPFACSVCGKAFARQHDRKRHEDLHTGEKRFVCSGTLFNKIIWGCSRRFARADALGRHFRTEAGKACIAPLREDIVSKIGQTTDVSEGIVFEGVFDGEPKLVAQGDDENQTRRAVIISAIAEQIAPLYA